MSVAKTARQAPFLSARCAARSAQSRRASRSVGMADRHHERLNGIFNAMDADKSGEVTPLEFIDHMLGTQMEHETVSALFRKMDTDGNGSISRAEFLAGFDRLMAEWAQPGPAVGSQEEAATPAATFAAVDADNSGKLDLEELLSALAAAGDVTDRAEVEALFKRLDVDGDGDPTLNPNPEPKPPTLTLTLTLPTTLTLAPSLPSPQP